VSVSHRRAGGRWLLPLCNKRVECSVSGAWVTQRLSLNSRGSVGEVYARGSSRGRKTSFCTRGLLLSLKEAIRPDTNVRKARWRRVWAAVERECVVDVVVREDPIADLRCAAQPPADGMV